MDNWIINKIFYLKDRVTQSNYLVAKIFVFVFFLKILLLAFTSHPFDFASYVFLVRQPFDLGGGICFSFGIREQRCG